jgi:hypothetical protein
MRGALAVGIIVASLGGCAGTPVYTDAPDCAPINAATTRAVALYGNPVFVPVADPQCAWETVVGMVSAYFRIEREEPVRMVGNILTEGSITTAAEVSPTIFEPWRHDTVDPEDRIENTLQSMRRRAVVRVIPAQGGHWVEVTVYKELEDVVRPEHASAGIATFRYDDTFTRVENPILGQQITQGWIPRGRDASLEQHMIGDLLSRCAQPAAR